MKYKDYTIYLVATFGIWYALVYDPDDTLVTEIQGTRERDGLYGVATSYVDTLLEHQQYAEDAEAIKFEHEWRKFTPKNLGEPVLV